MSSEDLFEIIALFASETAGYLTVENVIEMFKSFEFDNQLERKKMVEYLFENKSKIPVETFIEKLQLDNAGTRVDINKLDQSQT